MAGGEADRLHPLNGDESARSAGARVRVLAPGVASQIAAGEVVERPASVVKELIENALDAGARRVTVEIEAAGCALIAVVDDGEGMVAEDAVRAFSRHATSKVATIEDLERIATLGFRGEALASIAAVSRTTLVTRRREDESGHRVEVDYGTMVGVRAAGTPPGTRVEVADLFANTPARRKFLKAPATEVGHVTELVTRTALAWPEVGFVLRHGGRTLAEFPGVSDPAERVRQVFGTERSGSMLAFAGRGAAGRAHGWLSAARVTFPSARQIYTYVNRRYVRDKLISHALVAGYRTLLMHGRYPAAVVFLKVPLDEIDVNVHPAKSEVRFRRAGAVHELLSQAVQTRLREHGAEHVGFEAVARAGPVAPMSMSAHVPFPPAPRPWSSGSLSLRTVDVGDHLPSIPFADARRGEPSEAAQIASTETRDEGGFFASLRIVGQAFEGYVIGENGRSLVLIDQHAAHERVTFEHLRTAYGQGAVARQQLLIPVVVELGPRAAALLNERVIEIEALGFEVEPFGGSSFAVRAVPALLGDSDPAALLRDVAEELVEIGGSRRVGEAAESVLARLACHSAVRVGQSMGAAQIRALLHAMDRVDFAGNCPHGRPAYVTLSRGDIERWFKRT